jgi:hypothetical protein
MVMECGGNKVAETKKSSDGMECDGNEVEETRKEIATE